MTPPVITDLSALPLILLLDDVAQIYRISPATVRRRLQNGTFRPRPREKYPYRWSRAQIVADLQRPPEDLPRRPHGFATTRARAKAANAALRKPVTTDKAS